MFIPKHHAVIATLRFYVPHCIHPAPYPLAAGATYMAFHWQSAATMRDYYIQCADRAYNGENQSTAGHAAADILRPSILKRGSSVFLVFY